ncbi:hypothetical protein RJ640_023902 [Escallonia rubra]|uniref:non-specific serine/threonine protein kinase n=1 Tax=Escallonia rubra TaxID=112253 RepID=A0AA88R703_9ASTE|nr:hypothetical protein RJ640_023902 [Escallonia rubra]
MSSICAVNALKEIAEQLGKSDWDFNLNPCDGNSGGRSGVVLCDGPNRDGVSHVTEMTLGNNLFSGTVPAELGRLTTYEADQNSTGEAKFNPSPKNWGTSSTGQFWDRLSTSNEYTAKNVSVLRMSDSELYTTARLSPLSLTYYARCLANGNYTVTLHFAEIIFRDNQSYQSLGRRVFDVYIQGLLLDGTVIAVKELSSKSKQGSREFVNEIAMISGSQHPNLVRLYGCCIEGKHLLLVYEYMENNSLAHALFGQEGSPSYLDWPSRQRICIGIAKGLVYLHEESPLKIVHRDIKATNVLLDSDLNAKISDFGLAKLDEEENTHISTRVAGTIGYMAPEYALWGHLTYKADVYSFGVVALEIVAGKNNVKYRPSEDYVCLLDWAFVLQRKGSLMELMDPRLGSNFDKKEAIRMIKVALLCANPSPALRPMMSAVVGMLQGHISVQEVNMDPSIYGDDLMFQSLSDTYNEMRPDNASETEALAHSSDVTRNDSSSTSYAARNETEALAQTRWSERNEGVITVKRLQHI